MPPRAIVGATIAAILVAGGGVRVDADDEVSPARASGERPAWSAGLFAQVLRDRDQARRSGDDQRAAELNRALATAADDVAIRVHDAWMTRRVPGTGLFPQSGENYEWNYRNTAADFFGFQLALAIEQRLPSVPLLRQTLSIERAHNSAGRTGGLCQCLDARTGAVIATGDRERLFSTCEYLKDGLMPLYERTGDADVLARMREIADAIVAACNVESRYGKIPSRDSEINGDVLQAFGRLGFACGERGKEYHELLGRLADAAIMQMLGNPAGPGAPVHFYDYPNDRFPSGVVRLRDHGNETAVGLAEAFATSVARSDEAEWKARADRWAAPLARIFELVLSRGVNEQGLLVTQLDGGGGRDGGAPHQLEITDAEPCDNWGYLLCGVLLFVQAEERHGMMPRERLDGLLARVDAIARAVARTDNLRWEGDNPDGWADTIESALQVAWHRPSVRQVLLSWVDSQIGFLFASQRPDGFCTGDYLDGNVIRTAMMYADARSGRPGPKRWRECVRLPWDWARINSWPSWDSDTRH